MDVKRRYEYENLIFFTLSVVFFSFIINLFIRKNIDFGYLNLSVYDMDICQEINLSSVIYVLMKRLEQFIVVFALMRTFGADMVYKCILICFGMVFGTLVTVQIYYDGIAGIILLLLYLIPHYIIYIYLLKIMRSFFMPERINQKKIVFLLCTGLILLLGVVAESILSRFFLYKFYQYMVSV